MTFWIITAALTFVISLLLGLALRRGAQQTHGAQTPADYDLQVYRDQLREVDRDVSRGVVDAADADRLRAEISRRILAADTARQAEAASAYTSRGHPMILAGVVMAALLGGSFALYLALGAPGYGDLSLKTRITRAEDMRQNRPGQQQAEASLPATPGRTDANPDYAALVEQLREKVAERPDDLQGQILLAQNEATLGNFAAAARAQANVLRIMGADATPADLTDYADMLVVAAGGYVSPEAEAVLRQVLEQDPQNGPARYYLGLMLAQTGRPDQAFRLWDQLLRAGPADAPWIPPILSQIEAMAQRAGVAYQLPEIGTAPIEAPRGPDADDVAAAQDMTPAERMQMIAGMVSGLSNRLATEGGPPRDWAQLIGALGVLDQRGRAAAIYANAIEVFADDPLALDLLLQAGQRAGVAE